VEFAVFVFACAIVTAIRFAKSARTPVPPKESQCLTCMYVVLTRGTRGEEWIACSYGGAMRAIKFTVCWCTAYRATSVSEKLVTTEGFARESP